MNQSNDIGNSQFDIVIIQCCQNCETHQNFSRHSQWKYFEQFNELKRKIEKFVPNTIVIKNPVPDELIKTAEIKNEKNMFVKKETNQKIIYPRIGSFEVYIYNILISSKLLTTQWPNHYKILQTVTKIIEEKKKGNSLQHFSVYNQNIEDKGTNEAEHKDTRPLNLTPQKKNVRISSKKKKVALGLASKAYKSIDKNNDGFKEMKSTLDPISQKLAYKDEVSPNNKGKRNVHRYLQSKADNRVKLPSLSNTMANLKDESPQQKVGSQKNISNPIHQMQMEQGELSVIEKKNSEMYESRKFSLLELKSEEVKNNSVVSVKQEDLRFFEDRSAQYSEAEGKDIMNRSIQYEQEQGFYCDFGMQIDQDKIQIDRQINFQWVQTDRIEIRNQPKPYTLQEQTQANIILKIPSSNVDTQTTIKQFVDQNIGTEMVITVSRQLQFPEQVSKSFNINEVVDVGFQHLYEKRRNILDNEDYYSIDRYEQKATKYKWIGRGKLNDNPQELKKKIFLQCLVFSVYNYYGIKTPEKRLSYQMCSNVVGQKLKEGILHILTFDNPELQYVTQFQDFNYPNKKFPLSQVITFKSSKQPIKFNNYGGFLALAYFLNDFQIFNPQNNQLGFVIVNETVKQIHKLSALNYIIHPQNKNSEQEIIVSFQNNDSIKINRLSQSVQLEFFSMLARICDHTTFEELIKYIREIFIHQANTYQQFKMTILSLHLESSEEQTVEDFIKMLGHRIERIKEIFKGKLYTYRKYRNLTPSIKFSIPFEHKIQRKLYFKDKTVNVHDIVKHLRNNNTVVIIQGEQGSGKTTLLNEMHTQLKSAEKINVMNVSWLKREPLKIKEQMFQLSKNVILIDNAQHFQTEVIELLELLSKTTYEVALCICTCSKSQKEILKNRFSTLTIVSTNIIPFTTEQIKEYMMKVVKSKSYTDKKDIIEQVISQPKYVKTLEIPFYLSLYATYLSTIDGSAYKPKDHHLTKYYLIKEHFSNCTTQHGEEMKEMGLPIKEALPNLRRISFEYYHNGEEVNEVIKDIITTYEENELIRSQLVYYPINLDSPISANYQPLFTHHLFFKFFLTEAYSYFIEKGFRNMRMQKFYNDKLLLDLIIERYKIEETYSQLLQIVMSTKKFKTISEASSNALTLLTKMGYVFSNINFDDCVIPFADLSNSIFYQCSFRGCDLQEAILYKAQMISCTFDGAAMARINLFSRKYEIEFTAMTCSISVDSRRLAFGCGNYLIILNAETGAEIKRIEAHLDIIRLVKYTRDGNSLVTIADDKTLRIWDIYTYKSVVFKLPQKGSIGYSNETESIASVSKNVLKVWNLKSMANEAQLQGHTEQITTIQFSYDGQLILTGSKDTTLRLWTLRGKQISVFKGHDEQILVGKLSPNKRTMVSSSKGKDLIMWSVESGTKIISKKFMSQIPQICLDNTEKYILVTFGNDNHIVIIDFLTFEIVHVLVGHESKIMSLHFDNNFQQLISLGKDRTARVWQFSKIMESQLRYPNINKKIKKGPVLALAYDKQKAKYVTSHENGELNIWNAENNELLDQLISHSGPVRCLAIDHSSKIYSGGSDGALRIWNLQIKKEAKTIQIHSSEMIQLKLSEKNRFIVTSSTANELVIQDFTGIKIIMSTRQQGRVAAIAFSQDQKLMAVGGTERYVAIYEVTNNNSVNRTTQLGQHSDVVTALTFFSDFLLVVALKNGQVAIWNHHRASIIKKIENVSPIRSLMQFQKKFICFTAEDGKIRIVNMDEGKEVRVFRYSEIPTAIDLNEDDSLLVTGTDSGNILKWNLNCVKPPTKKIEFDRKAIDQECTRVVTVESGRSLLIKDLFYHKEEVVEVKIDSDIEGVTFDEDKIIMLLKNGKYWQYGKKQYKFHSTPYLEGDLHSIRDKYLTNFFKSGIKKIKGMNKPSLSVLQEINRQ